MVLAPALTLPTGAVSFDEVILALHIMAVVVAFGAAFAEPLFVLVGARLDPAAMPWFHRMQQAVGRRLVSPGLVIVVVFGVILASEFHAWKAFYVQWGIGAAIVIGALEGMVLIPRAGRLAALADRDLADGAATLSGEYRVLRRQTLLGGSVVSLLVLITVFLMTIRAGA